MPTDTDRQDSPTLTIQQMARQSGLSEHTLRYYERIGLLTPIPRNTSSGHRRYSPAAADTIESLACLRATGMSISALRKLLTLRAQGEATAAEQQAMYAAQEAVLAAEMAQLAVRRQYLVGKVAYLEAVQEGDTAKADAQAEINYKLAALLARKQEMP